MEADCGGVQDEQAHPFDRQCLPGLCKWELGQGWLGTKLVCSLRLGVLHCAVLRKKLWPLRRAHRVHPCQSCGQGSCASSAVPNEDPCPSMLLQSATPWRCHCQQDLVHSGIEESMA